MSMEVAEIKITKADPTLGPETETITYREPSQQDVAVYARVLERTLISGRDTLDEGWLDVGSTTTPLVDALTAETRLLRAGYLALADDDLLLAEADLPAMNEVLPPE